MRTRTSFVPSRPLQAAAQSLVFLTIMALAPAPTLAQGNVGGLSSQPIGLDDLRDGQPYPRGIAGTPGAPGFPGGVMTRRSWSALNPGAGMTKPVAGIGPRLPTYRGTSVMPAGRVARPGTTADTWPGSSRRRSPTPPAHRDAFTDAASRQTAPIRPARANSSSTTARRPTGSGFSVGSTVVGSTTARRRGMVGPTFDGWHRGSPSASMLGDANAGARSANRKAGNRGYGFKGW